jgi:hypothetical protein
MLLRYRLTHLGLVFPDDDDPNGLGRPIKSRAECLGVAEDDPSAILDIG